MTVRLDKLLIDRGVGSRKEVRKLVKRGLVEVEGAVERRHDGHVERDARVAIDGIEWPPLPRIVAWHKPTGVVSTMGDRHGRADLSDALPPPWGGRLHPVGRLDADTSGLLLFSLDGKLTQWLLHPKRAVPRTYMAVVENPPTPELVDVMAKGVETSDGVFGGTVEHIEGAVVRLTVTEGKHRMVRRMLANAGHPVLELVRVRYGAFALGDLPVGDCREATPEELAWLVERNAPADPRG